MRAAFFKGVRLWEALQEMPAFASRTGEKAHSGVRQRNQKANPQSPNFERPCDVRCVVEVRVEDIAPGYETGTVIENTLHDIEDRLQDASFTAGDLCFCEDDGRVATITNSETAGPNVEVEHGTPGEGWVLAVGELVLFRNPTTGAGFHARIEAVGSGTVTCDLEQDLSSAWRMVRVERVLPEAVYERMSKVGVRDESDPEVDCREVHYLFTIYGDPVKPTASVLSTQS
jgi:hypothetical protein